jgi:uncharacterized protein (TIGR03067 family)
MHRFFAAACLLLVLGLSAAAKPETPPPSAAEIDKLVHQLGSRRFAEREAATKALEKAGEPALAALRKAATSDPDAEVRRRAGKLVRSLDTGRRLGTWRIVSIEFRGQVGWKPPHHIDEFTFTKRGVEGELWVYANAEYQVDALTAPQHIDMLFYMEDELGRRGLWRTWRGIYRFEKDELLLCFDAALNKQSERPTEFKTKAGSDVVVYRMRREKPGP